MGGEANIHGSARRRVPQVSGICARNKHPHATLIVNTYTIVSLLTGEVVKVTEHSELVIQMGDAIAEHILNTLSAGARGASDLFEFVRRTPKGTSVASLEFIERAIQRDRGKRESEERERRVFSTTIWRLKRDGLVESEGRKVSLTSRGIAWLAKRREKQRSRGTLPKRKYTREEGKDTVVVSFDIPEHDRRKRDWFRCVLVGLGYEMVHRSVWVGRMRIPRDLLDDMRAIKIVEYVKMFAVTKRGTLERIE